MTELFQLNSKLSLSSAPADETTVPSEDAMRQALLRMGSGARPQGFQGRPRAEPQQQNGGHDRDRGRDHGRDHGRDYNRGHDQYGQGHGSQGGVPNGEVRRRRFSQNEHVPVEYVGRERGPAVRAETPEAVFGAPAPDQDSVGRLERALKREQQAREAAEQAANEAKLQLQSLRTRLAHVEIELNEMRSTRAAEAAAAAVAIANAVSGGGGGTEAAVAEEAAVSRPRGRPRLRRAELSEEEEQEPVKWWTD